MFPGYLFARLDDGARVRASVSTLGTVPRWVDFGEGPITVPEDLISGLREREKNGLIEIVDDSPLTMFAPGDAVRVLDGPFAGFQGLFARDSGRRIVVLLQMMAATREVEIDRTWAERAFA